MTTVIVGTATVVVVNLLWEVGLWLMRRRRSRRLRKRIMADIRHGRLLVLEEDR